MGDFRWHDGKGGLFRADKQGNDDRPDMTGMATFQGETIVLSGWFREGKNGRWISLQVQSEAQRAKYGKKKDADDYRPPASSAPAPAPAAEFEDDIPF